MNVEAQDGGGERTAINTCAGLWVVRRLSNGFIRGLPHRMFVVLTLRLLPATDMCIEGLCLSSLRLSVLALAKLNGDRDA